MSGGLHRWGDGVERDRAFHVCAGSEVNPIDAATQHCMGYTGKPVYWNKNSELVLPIIQGSVEPWKMFTK